MSFDMAKNVERTIGTQTFHVAIADEAHYLKSRDAKRTKILSPLLMNCKRIILLSGTPMLARPVEVYNLVHILRPDLFPSFHEFGFRYCSPRPTYFGTDWGNASNPDELHLILSNTVMIRRLKSQVLQELPSKRRQKIQVETETRIVRSIKKILQKWTEKELKLALGKGLDEDFNYEAEAEAIEEEDRDIHKNIILAYKLTGISKSKGICDFLDILIDNETKFILFAHHLELLSDLESFVIRRRRDYIRIDGSVPAGKRHQLVSKYQSDEKCRIALLSLTASSQGVTLTASSTVVFAELNWTPGVMEQAEDRVHRIGQKNAVTIYYLYADNTLDPLIYNIIRAKNVVVAQALNGKKSKFAMEDGSIEKTKLDLRGKIIKRRKEEKKQEELLNDKEENAKNQDSTDKKSEENVAKVSSHCSETETEHDELMEDVQSMQDSNSSRTITVLQTESDAQSSSENL
eukprot:TRINITY_DN7516_c0_g1_i3.p1 TRINITY_DN7516_c0_g1~~TRINITY_DN7516_c0_g1_i3.p1  ORF type:complete len:461 (+),score=131.55 TRINITY_DN7516_c0_g1_i3:104-1486(+)